MTAPFQDDAFHDLAAGLTRGVVLAVQPFVLAAPHDLDEQGPESAFQGGLVAPPGEVVVVAVSEAPLITTKRAEGYGHDRSFRVGGDPGCEGTAQNKKTALIERLAEFVFVGCVYLPEHILSIGSLKGKTRGK
jgi:hypothetical protein